MWGTTLSGPLPVDGLVGCYPANYLMGRSSLPQPRKFNGNFLNITMSCGISYSFD